MIIVIVMTGLASPLFEWHFIDRRQAENGLLSITREAPTPRRNASQPFHSRSCTTTVIT